MTFVSGEDWDFTYKSLDEIEEAVKNYREQYEIPMDPYDLPKDEEAYYYNLVASVQPLGLRDLEIYLDERCDYYSDKMCDSRLMFLDYLIQRCKELKRLQDQ